MFVELHVLQSFALSNLNRDDTGAPKSCVFGGRRRARISSQCLKRAVRTYFREESVVPSEMLSYRTKLLQRELRDRLADLGAETAQRIAANAIDALDLKLRDGKTQYLLMLGSQEIARLAQVCRQNAEALSADSQGQDKAGSDKKGNKKGKKDDSGVVQSLLAAIDGGDAVDLALFGRMIADRPEKSVDAAVQMAHAFSTHGVDTEFDFYSAVDDLQNSDSDEGAGAGMIGTTLYNSSCYYRYANLNLDQLSKNLAADRRRTEMATRAFVAGMIHAVPTGKQTSSAAQNPPFLILAVVRDSGLWSLANAFLTPVYAGAKGDLMQLSADSLLKHWGQLSAMYGTDAIRYAGLTTYLPQTVETSVTPEPSVSALLERVMREVRAGKERGAADDDIAHEA